MSDISVLGIFVADISFSGPKIPLVGETILGNKYNVGPGGKGCNQAIAIAKLGGNVNCTFFLLSIFQYVGILFPQKSASVNLKHNEVKTKNI